jgi:hypothetical protein
MHQNKINQFLTFGVPVVSQCDPSRKEEPSASLFCSWNKLKTQSTRVSEQTNVNVGNPVKNYISKLYLNLWTF